MNEKILELNNKIKELEEEIKSIKNTPNYITSYENSNYTKPNPKYFHMLLNKFNLEPEEVIIFGNNDVEDYLCGKYANIDCYLVGNSLILHEDKNIECKKINLEDIKKIIDLEIEKRK